MFGRISTVGAPVAEDFSFAWQWISRRVRKLNTPTHLLINWTVAKSLKPSAVLASALPASALPASAFPASAFPASAVLLGAVAPDIPLYILSFGGLAYFRGWEGRDWESIAQHLFGNLFYNDPVWISLHNCLHSPTMLMICLMAVYLRAGKDGFLQSWWAWFFASCMLHTAVDIPVHYDDGPLLFWPINWTYRFQSPVSYWDRNHYANYVIPLEFLMVAVLLGRLVLHRLSARRG